MLDVGSLLGSLVGQSEKRTRQALRLIDAMAPCVCMIDECEKAFAGASGQSDSGVSARVMGTFLSWLNDRTADVFVVCTANDISRLPPELARSERIDGVFFLDLPTAAEQKTIWQLYLELFKLDPEQKRPDDEQWTGAEIKACCRLAALLDVPLVQAAQNVVPVAVTAAESVSNFAIGQAAAACRLISQACISPLPRLDGRPAVRSMRRPGKTDRTSVFINNHVPGDDLRIVPRFLFSGELYVNYYISDSVIHSFLEYIGHADFPPIANHDGSGPGAVFVVWDAQNAHLRSEIAGC